MLDRLAVALDGLDPVVADLAREVRFRYFDQPVIDEARELASDAETPEAALVRAGEVLGLRAAIEALPEPFRETLVLRELEELSYREIADITGAPIGTVMSRLARARVMLAAALGVEEDAS